MKLDTADGILPMIEKAQVQCASLKKHATADIESIEVLLHDTFQLRSMADDYSRLIERIYDASKPLDKHAHAKQFAGGLLPILELAVSTQYLRDHISEPDVLLEVINGVIAGV